MDNVETSEKIAKILALSTAAYEATRKSFSEYRARVAEDQELKEAKTED